MPPGTALPAWLIELVPSGFTKKYPAFTEAAYAFVVSIIHGTGVIFPVLYGFAIDAGVGPNDLFGVIHYGLRNWLALTMGYGGASIVAGIRARSAGQKAQTAADTGKPAP